MSVLISRGMLWKMGAAPGQTSCHKSLRDEQPVKCENLSASRAPQPNGHTAVGPENRPVVVQALQIVRNIDATAHGGTWPLAVQMRFLTIAAVAADVFTLRKVVRRLAMQSSSVAIGMLSVSSFAAQRWRPWVSTGNVHAMYSTCSLTRVRWSITLPRIHHRR